MLDTNVYCRLLDDFTIEAIKKEAKNAEIILELAQSNVIEIITSEILLFEVNKIDEKEKRDFILLLIGSVERERTATTEITESLIRELLEFTNNVADSNHLAIASTANCEYFLTCDQEILKRTTMIERFLFERGYELNILNPVVFVKRIIDRNEN